MGNYDAAFMAWYKALASLMGLDSNPDDPRHYYNYREAFARGMKPSYPGTPTTMPDTYVRGMHWPSLFKQEGHPNLIINGKDTRYENPYEEGKWNSGSGS